VDKIDLIFMRIGIMYRGGIALKRAVKADFSSKKRYFNRFV
tara:strand:+ start:1145 stop:1267 length:123 start_codon:yes stop_codon:yes gene_type:complete